MRPGLAVVSIVAASLCSGVGGFAAGSRHAHHNHAVLDGEYEASRAQIAANLLQAIRAGKTDVAVSYLESSLDTSFANFSSEESVARLSPSGRSELRVAVQYRDRVPSEKRNADWDSRVEKGLQFAR